MSRIPDEVIEQVRDTADLVAIIGESVELKRTGTDYRGPCPFHGGTNRNFAVVPKRGMYYCFVCHESGDVFKYLMKRFGMDYPTAVRAVASKSGIVIPETTERAGPDPREPLYSAVATAHDWFQRQLRELPEAEAARAYVAKRGLTPEQAAELGLGYAPAGPAFQQAMTALGISAATLLEAGLTAERQDGSVGPRFRQRLLIPIHDLRGRVVAFGGRILGEGEPKYLNSPESPVYHKGEMLYNLHAAKQSIRKEEMAIVVEGYFDTLRLVLAGVENVVAPLGTSLTDRQAALLRKFTPAVTVLYDSDGPGLRAAFRAADELLRHGVRVRVATLPDDEDPDSLVETQGVEALRKVLHDAEDVIERKIGMLERKGWFADVEHRREALDRLLPTIRATSDPITRELYLTTVAERAKVSRDVLQAELAKRADNRMGGRSDDAGRHGPGAPSDRPSPRPSDAASSRPSDRPTPRRRSGDEKSFLRVLLALPEWRERARQDAVKPEWFERKEYREVFAQLLAGAALPDALSDEAQLAWSELQASAHGLTENAGDVYEAAREALEARPLLRQFDALQAQIDVAGPDELEVLLRRKEEMRADLKRRFPNEWQRRPLRRAGRR
ncbi:MAG TPA: DNA primase [Gemmatimonadales bacterium]|nr:DNA primase [Gemmatimonadales bacterium]